MCRNIRTLFNFKPPATNREIHDAALQFVREISGFNSPTRANEVVFEAAVEEISKSVREMLDGLVTTAPPRNREEEIEKTRAGSDKRNPKPRRDFRR